MRSIKFCFTVFFIGLIIYPVFSQQDETSWMKYDKRIILDKVMNVEYSHPEGFIGDSTAIYCKMLTYRYCAVSSLVTEDRSFMVFYMIINPTTEEDSIRRQDTYPVVDMMHVYDVNHIVKTCFGDDADWKDYVRYYSSDDAKTKFNADTVLSISLLIDKDEDYYDDGFDNYNYSHCTVLIIQKQGRGMIAMYCIYDEDATKNLDTYMTAIEGTLRYRESDPELKKWEIDDYITPFRTQRRARIIR